MPSKTKIGTEVAHVTRIPLARSTCRGRGTAGHILAASRTAFSDEKCGCAKVDHRCKADCTPVERWWLLISQYGRIPLFSVTDGQYDARPTITFPASQTHAGLARSSSPIGLGVSLVPRRSSIPAVTAWDGRRVTSPVEARALLLHISAIAVANNVSPF